MNLYDQLGLDVNCTFDEIKQQYRVLAQKHHPDKGGDVEVFKKIKLAYEVLSDPARRAEYDETGKVIEDLPVRTEALKELPGLMHFCIDRFNPEHDDLFFAMKREIEKGFSDFNTNIDNCNVEINKLKNIYDKVNRKTEGENIFKSFINEKLKYREGELKSLYHKIKVFKCMSEILDDYYYGLDLTTLLENVGAAGGS